MVPRVIRAYQLKPGDRFSFIPAEWFGPGVVRESYGTREKCSNVHWLNNLPLVNGKRIDGTWTLKFDNSKVVNPPGLWYGHPETKVRLLKRGKAARKAKA